MQKMKSKKGFTLIEMLIVVGIIAILVAVSIPVVNSSLEKARYATDAANERAAKAALMIEYLTNDKTPAQLKDHYYDAAKGNITEDTTAPAGYGRCNEHKDGVLKVTKFLDDGTYEIQWAEGSVSKPELHGTDAESVGSAVGG